MCLDEDLDSFFGSQQYTPTQGSGGPSDPVEADDHVEEETTSHATSDSAHGGCKLNEDADDLDAEEEEVQEVKPMGRGKAKKKASSSSAPSEYSIFPPLVDQLVDK
ncbi:hypothetical protein Tco_0737147 [Tanacetum coccineum]